MNDKEILIAMFKRNEIEYQEQDNEGIWIEAGYIGFVSCFTFREDGSLLAVKAFE